MTPYIQSLYLRKSALNLILGAIEPLLDTAPRTGNLLATIYNHMDEIKKEIHSIDEEVKVEEYHAKFIVNVVNVGDSVRFKDDFAVDAWYTSFHNPRRLGAKIRHPFDIGELTFTVNDIRSAQIWCHCEGKITIGVNIDEFKRWMEVIS